MFAVIFEVQPRAERWDSYFDHARILRPELERIDGFIDNVRSRSLTREGCLLSLSAWRDEKAVIRWRTTARHHVAQERGREEIFRDYHLRVGEVTDDTHVPAGEALREQRLDETEAGEATTVVLVTGRRAERDGDADPGADAAALGLDPVAPGLVGWDVFEAVLTPGDVTLLTSWRDRRAALAYLVGHAVPEGARRRCVRVVRDYGLLDRREAPQYYPEVVRAGA